MRADRKMTRAGAFGNAACRRSRSALTAALGRATLAAGMMRFRHLVHADWSLRPQGRWQASARRTGGGWRIDAPRPVGEVGAFVAGILAEAGGDGALLGVDLPIGGPRAWAERAGVADFLAALRIFGEGAWRDVYAPAGRPEEVSPFRPFYPAKPGGAKQAHLADGIGVAGMAALRRWCEFSEAGRGAATPVFWTLGGAQVGKAAGAFWRDVLQPGLADGRVAVWPFEGTLDALAAPGRVVVAETYPAEVYRWFDLAIRGPRLSKRRIADRRGDAARLLAAGAALGADFAPAAAAAVRDGFPAGGEDAFDAMVGLIGLLATVTGARPPNDPDDAVVRRIEGWILGRKPGPRPY